MAMRFVVSRSGLCRLMEHNWASSPSRSLSDGSGRVFNEEERAQEAVFIKKMEREKMEKLKKTEDQPKPKNDKFDKKAEDDVGKN